MQLQPLQYQHQGTSWKPSRHDAVADTHRDLVRAVGGVKMRWVVIPRYRMAIAIPRKRQMTGVSESYQEYASPA